MNTYLKKKKSALNTHKTVRNAIQLNKYNRMEVMNNAQLTPEKNIWANNWIEQAAEMKSGSHIVSQTSLKKNKLIVKWWAN